MVKAVAVKAGKMIDMPMKGGKAKAKAKAVDMKKKMKGC